MSTFQLFFITVVLLIHVYILLLEMFFWTKPKGIKTFGLASKEFAEKTKVLAANQGLYNGFLVAGFVWAIISEKNEIAFFFLSCVCVAGIYGAYSTKKTRIFFIQSVPAILGLISFCF
ncbi:DUF1304 domain-containing protein [Tenacibaculum sp. UWU-22]|uniref:DUF1304 domain-containing protein n=1 Tax=Tenacibaculum sp. UWU-22 TaxID=3234187 RepID=UPI0034DB1BF3